MALIAACRKSSFISFMRWKHVAASVCSVFTSSKHAAKEDSSAHQYADVQFTVFYRFPYITTARFISRLKLYQTAVVCVAVPPTLYCYKIGAVGFEQCMGVVAASTLALIMLYVAANFFQRVVGLAAFNSDQRLVRLSHLTFFGGRNDVIVPVDDLVPFSDIGEKCNDVFVKVHRYSTTDTLYMSLLYGRIENAETFHQVFGILV